MALEGLDSGPANPIEALPVRWSLGLSAAFKLGQVAAPDDFGGLLRFLLVPSPS